MKTVMFEKEGTWCLGIKRDKGILDVSSFYSLEELLSSGQKGRELLETFAQQEEQSNEAVFLDEQLLKLGPCVPAPSKIICVGLNYRKHAEESGMQLPKEPILFSKYTNALSGHRQEIELPAISNEVDYEAELGVVIGRRVRKVGKEEALDAVYGYCCANDLSARDLQFRSSQWLLGKSSDGFAPIGPYLVTADEIKDPQSLRIRAYVNGELRQDSNTRDMIFDCAEIISYISSVMTLEPGDLILTGTPEGVIMGQPEAQRSWLKPGDEVTVEIEGLGRLTNTFRKEQG
ncbi:FAA hydrolase family protein [Paenibacillus sp. CAA11]|uniref:fumarylacetoacetate hydrolase family protein n=1 Tax=Paenibacillus sp. CAA11 TaxID=1532905 RepID=UPI000D390E21|nr:fumarylacetoacetate hydrolase family protein [Paenibacillus sp. CAA11]AWB43868.1 FAA hydrolase family protein [Paenibacillus sp. CAA11]